ncbi:7-cyano-7-deazaguanine synthase [Rubripirellula lacrimiformis]|uniref:7-cyano-7-deazaguanine synthase n=1 Tax=Rubripirellula lacrimiformis TaxID=1930273 RepID=A0A517N671_9BACT|nr:7-cyano-7-deazaguanine synthase QueC [Rubripirellula lacrimiformis]QDT02508.1 7-cyano-7-deazaguanine synthase [Rubripirellula lacrimiformis]
MTNSRPAVVLLSGGLDSATCLAIARDEGFTPHAISFRYGQRHQYELDRAIQLAKNLKAASHRIVDIDLSQFGGSALTDASIPVPKTDHLDNIGDDIPVTYVPARNTVFLSLALAMAETIGSRDIFIGVNALDYSGYPDCRPEFVEAFEQMANLATKASVDGAERLRIHTPLIDLTKGQIIATGIQLGVDYGQTLSCYDPGQNGTACGQCDACLLRAKGFAENSLTDPAA